MSPNDHDFDDPTEYLDRLEMAVNGATMPKCPHCHERRDLLPLPGTGWAIEHFHEPGCPNNEEDPPNATEIDEGS